MGTAKYASRLARSEDLVLALFAAASLNGTSILELSDTSMHRRFDSVLKVLESAGGDLADLAKLFHKNVVNGTYDLLNLALVSAEHGLWVKFPNPSYSRVLISMTPREAQGFLREWPGVEQYINEAAALLSQPERVA